MRQRRSFMSHIAVIDVETTGINPHYNNRIVELAVLVMRPDGEVLRKFVTLVNPERDIGPTHIHGLSSRDVLSAPRFHEIAGELLEVLGDCVAIAGHNVWFDYSFLSAEFARLGSALTDIPRLCTMILAGGGNLPGACADYGIDFDGDRHSACADATAAARLLTVLLKDAPQLTSEIASWRPIEWPKICRTEVKPFTRDQARALEMRPPSYLQRLLNRMKPELPPAGQVGAAFAYEALLDRVLEDRHIDESEGEALLDLAVRWNVSNDEIRKIHRAYFSRVATAAFADTIVTDPERRDLLQVATLLGIDAQTQEATMHEAATQPSFQEHSPCNQAATERAEMLGFRVCFTGECQCRVGGEVITRQRAASLAAQKGMIVVESVSRKLNLLVVADPLTQSGKATKARKYGIRVMHELVFWRSIGLDVE